MAVVAPAGPVDPLELEQSLAALATRFDVVCDEAVRRRQGYHAGTDDERLAALQQAIDDPRVKAVVAARGGYGTTRLLDRLDLSGLAQAPKWLVGCSDLTSLLLTVYHELGLATVHGPMAASLLRTDAADVNELSSLLTTDHRRSDQPLVPTVPGFAKGPLLGGNLTVLAHLVGALPRSAVHGAVLFLEDVGEAPYRLDRCLVQLARAGWLSEIAGVVVGELFGCEDEADRYGITAEAAMEARLRELGLPTASGYPAAHGRRNRPFIHGAVVTLEVDSSSARLLF